LIRPGGSGRKEDEIESGERGGQGEIGAGQDRRKRGNKSEIK